MKTLTITERTRKEHGYQVTFWQVTGSASDGSRIRKRFKTREQAVDWKNLKEIELANQKNQLHNVVTALTAEQVKQAEAAFTRLGSHFDLATAVEFFLYNHSDPEQKIPIHDAADNCVRSKRAAGVRERSLKQLEATLVQFNRHCVTNGLENLHDVTTPDVERFLKSLRARDGVNPASKKTWNNYRADIHALFNWCAENDMVAANPVAKVIKHKRLSRGIPETLTVSECRDLMMYVAEYRAGRLVPYFALALFTGIRTGVDGELHKLAAQASELIDLERGVVRLPPEVSKTNQYRQVDIHPNLAAWLSAFRGPILPPNHSRDIKEIRRRFGVGHDVLRHTFFSMHVSAFRSVGDAAIQGGNSEGVLKKHYLNLATREEGQDFWKIMPPEMEEKIVHLTHANV